MTVYVNPKIEDVLAKEIDDALREELLRGSCGYSTYPKFQVPKDSIGTIYVSIWQGGAIDLDYIWKASYSTQQEEHKMYVYDVVVVYKPDDEIVYDDSITASTSEQAKMFALADIMRESAPTNEVIANYHFAVKQVGEGYSK